MTYGYLDHCPLCGSERGPGGHECQPRDCVDVERFREVTTPEPPPPSDPPKPVEPSKPWPAWVADTWVKRILGGRPLND